MKTSFGMTLRYNQEVVKVGKYSTLKRLRAARTKAELAFGCSLMCQIDYPEGYFNFETLEKQFTDVKSLDTKKD